MFFRPPWISILDPYKKNFYSATDNSGNQPNIPCKEIVEQNVTRLKQMYDQKISGMYPKYEKLRKDILEVGLQILRHKIHKNMGFYLFRIFLFVGWKQEHAHKFFHSFVSRRYQRMNFPEKKSHTEDTPPKLNLHDSFIWWCECYLNIVGLGCVYTASVCVTVCTLF